MSIRSTRASPEDRSVRPASTSRTTPHGPPLGLAHAAVRKPLAHHHGIHQRAQRRRQRSPPRRRSRRRWLLPLPQRRQATYTYNYFERKITTITSPDPLPPGPATIRLDFASDGGGIGKSALAMLCVNNLSVAKARIERTVQMAFSFEDTFDIGEDSALPVATTKALSPLPGIIDHINFDISN